MIGYIAFSVSACPPPARHRKALAEADGDETEKWQSRFQRERKAKEADFMATQNLKGVPLARIRAYLQACYGSYSDFLDGIYDVPVL